MIMTRGRRKSLRPCIRCEERRRQAFRLRDKVCFASEEHETVNGRCEKRTPRCVVKVVVQPVCVVHEQSVRLLCISPIDLAWSAR